jgi:hypothetical protein
MASRNRINGASSFSPDLNQLSSKSSSSSRPTALNDIIKSSKNRILQSRLAIQSKKAGNDTAQKVDAFSSSGNKADLSQTQTSPANQDAQKKIEELDLKLASINEINQGQESSEVDSKIADNYKFSKFKFNYYNEQNTGLDLLKSQWQKVNFEGNNEIATEQISMISKQETMNKDVRVFWSEQEKFWGQLSSKPIPKENQAKVSVLVDKLAALESKIDGSYGDSKLVQSPRKAHEKIILDLRSQIQQLS